MSLADRQTNSLAKLHSSHGLHPLTADAGAKVDNTRTRKQSHQVQSPVNIGINTIHLVLTTKRAHPALSAWALHQRQGATASETPDPSLASRHIFDLVTHHPSPSVTLLKVESSAWSKSFIM